MAAVGCQPVSDRPAAPRAITRAPQADPAVAPTRAPAAAQQEATATESPTAGQEDSPQKPAESVAPSREPEAAEPAPTEPRRHVTTPQQPQAPQPPSLAIPSGPLDDDKYIAIAVKLALAVDRLKHEERTGDGTLLLTKQILKQADVTLQEFTDYTNAIAGDSTRQQRVAGAIEQRVEKLLKVRYGGDVSKTRPGG